MSEACARRCNFEETEFLLGRIFRGKNEYYTITLWGIAHKSDVLRVSVHSKLISLFLISEPMKHLASKSGIAVARSKLAVAECALRASRFCGS